MPNNQQQPQNEPRRAQPGHENPADGREDMERPELDSERNRERPDQTKRPQ
ncbi:MAG: hypothetical protein NT015_05545 [Alphaproteobacteria bacterium]|nr:hypothetical protein [Alphaproteobacteria bacterium]